MIAKTILTHVIARWCRFHFRFTFTRLVLSQLHSDPVREVLTVFDQLSADRIANFVEADGAVWHYITSKSVSIDSEIEKELTSHHAICCNMKFLKPLRVLPDIISSQEGHLIDRQTVVVLSSPIKSAKKSYYKYVRIMEMPIAYGYT